MSALMQTLKDRLKKRKEAYLSDPLFHQNEIQANRMMGIVLFNSGIILIAIWLAAKTGVFELAKDLMDAAVLQGLVEIALLCVVSWRVKQDAWWLKNLLLLGSAIVYARMDMIFTHKAALLMVIPVVCSCRYYSRRLTIGMSLLTTVLFAFSAAYGANNGLLNLNDLTLPIGTTMTTTGTYIDSAVEQVGFDPALLTRNVMLYSYLPKWLVFSVVSVISAKIARRGREMVLEQKGMAQKQARIETELDLATRIQSAMLPSLFPPFPDRVEMDIYASMAPAKEVGGDFYDFYMLDENRLGLVMADVSGKGVPAALFMMASKILVKNYAMAGLNPGQILEKANNQICANNPEQMFVTMWLGILDLNTGRLTAANAGHEYPAIRRPGGVFALYKDKHSFAVGGMEGMRYKEYELQLEPGSRLFLYTDGVPEATDAQGRMFGAERMLDALNAQPDAPLVAILHNVRQAVDGFVGDAEQFDDLTMMCVTYRGKKES
ncbi:MAG: PP2C family protein-serine/threonine phosphatase [Clostridia bacterium]|nr:PP2C family protein-serine/threonine phosphatase [Clostridia bacterium]